MAAKADTVIFHGGSISENVTRVMVYICTKFHASTYKPTILPHIYCTNRVQNPANPCKPAGAGEAQKKEGKGSRSTYATRVAEGQAPGDRKGRKSPSEPAAG